MSNSAEETTVTVEHTDEATPETPTVIVTDTGDDNNNDLEIGAALGALTVTVETLAGTVAALSERVDTLSAQQTYTEDIASEALTEAIDAQVAVEEAVEVAEEVAEETAEETAADEVEELIEPQREHFIWRNPVKLRRGVDA